MNASHLHPLTATKKTHYNRSNNPIKLLFYSKIVTLGVFLLVHWTSHISRKKINNEMSHIFDFIRALQISISLSLSLSGIHALGVFLVGRIKEMVMLHYRANDGLKSQPKAASFNLGPFFSTLTALGTVRRKILMVDMIALLDLCATTLL